MSLRFLTIIVITNYFRHRTFPTIISNLHDCTENKVITVRYRDPKYADGFIFPARKLEHASEPPKVLKQTVDQGRPNYRPVIGFNHNRSQFASVGEAGTRTVNHYTSNRNFDAGNGKFYLIYRSVTIS